LALTCAAALAACGGGGGYSGPSGGTGAPEVTSALGVGMYSQRALITVTGNYLDQGITVSSPTCTGMTLSSTAPYVSSASKAYYQCTTSGMAAYDVTVTRTSDGAALASAPFTVPLPQVTLTISNGAAVKGDVLITLAPDKTPISVDNFLAYVNAKFYDGTIFHRVVRDFLVQGGGLVPGTGGGPPVEKTTNPPIGLEVGKGLSNVQWSIGMARTNVVNSATSQFYVNVVDNSAQLDPRPGFAGYAVFGSVSAGTELLATMARDSCKTSAECLPSVNILITSAVQTR
jgi:cyclophilin family peptidyl-prolyl cis-trans isomerase